jgi:hypothetical protein
VRGRALANQLIIIPACALALCRFAGLSTDLTTGVLVVAIAPGSAPANLMTRLAHGNTALSLTLTAITNAVCFITMPLAISIVAWVTGGAADHVAHRATPGGWGASATSPLQPRQILTGIRHARRGRMRPKGNVPQGGSTYFLSRVPIRFSSGGARRFV